MTTFIRYPNKDLRLTETDRIWTARMVDAEGGGTEAEAALLLWTMIQRKYWGVGPYTVNNPVPRAFGGDSWTEFIRKFSQPINPAWYRDGRMCRPGGRWAGTEGCAENRLARRERLARTSIRGLKPLARRMADLFMAGQVPRPPSAIGVINFRARDEADVAAPLATFPFRTGNRYFYNLTGVSKDHPELAAIRFVVNGVEQPIIDLWSPAAVIPAPPPGPGGALLSLVPGAVTAFNNVGQNSER